ncbi:hypothetical protein B0H19DRAFT_1265458 [Mycena capillaripes]|nr:hypothetical protein B0H19DRAFT_1265458 [Mycena capillaripes]
MTIPSSFPIATLGFQDHRCAWNHCLPHRPLGKTNLEEVAESRAGAIDRIDAAIPLLQRWLNTPASETRSIGNIYRSSLADGRPNLMASMAAVMEQMPIDVQLLQPHVMSTPPHTLTELGLAGIHTLIKFPDNDDNLPHEKTKEMERLLRMVNEWMAGSLQMDKFIFMDEMIALFEAVPPGGGS